MAPLELLSDTHALLSWLAEPDRLSPAAQAAQAELNGLTLVSLDPPLQSFPCRLLW